MTHTALITAAYVIAVGGPLILAIGALLRIRTARRRLDAVETGRGRRGGGAARTT